MPRIHYYMETKGWCISMLDLKALDAICLYFCNFEDQIIYIVFFKLLIANKEIDPGSSKNSGMPLLSLSYNININNFPGPAAILLIFSSVPSSQCNKM